MAQRKTGRKTASKKAAPKKKVGKKRKGARRKSSASKARTASRPPASADQGAWSSARETQHQLKGEAILRVASRLINLKGYAGMSLADVADELDQATIRLCRSVAAVDQDDQPQKARVVLQVGFHERSPLSLYLLRDLGIPVAREVHEEPPVVDPEEVDLSRAAGILGYACQLLPAEQRVDQAGFPDVGSAGDRDLRQNVRRGLARLRYRADELGDSDRQESSS